MKIDTEESTARKLLRREEALGPVSQNAGSATTDWTCVCQKLLTLKGRDGGMYVPIHAHKTEGGMCSASGTRVLRDIQIDAVSVVAEDPWKVLGPEVEAELKPVPLHVARSAERLDQNLADARSGGYYNHGWGGYMDRIDVERLISYVLAQPRSTT